MNVLKRDSIPRSQVRKTSYNLVWNYNNRNKRYGLTYVSQKITTTGEDINVKPSDRPKITRKEKAAGLNIFGR